MGSHFLMQLHDSHIFAYGLHILYNDNLAIDIEAQLLEFCGYLDIVYATVNHTRSPS